MNQENMTGNPTLDLLNQASGMSEFQAPKGDFNNVQSIYTGNASTGNPTLDLLNQTSMIEPTTNIFGGNVISNNDVQHQGEQQPTPMTGNPTIDLLNQTTVIPPQNGVPDYSLETMVQSETQFTSPQVVDNPMMSGQSQFVTIQPEMEQPIIPQPVPTQDLQVAAFGNQVNQPTFIQQSPEALFDGDSGNAGGSNQQGFNPFDFGAQ